MSQTITSDPSSPEPASATSACRHQQGGICQSLSPGGVLPVRKSFDLSMDLAILRQLRSHERPFRRGSPAMELVAGELSNSDLAKFGGITKKGVRDRDLLLRALFNLGRVHFRT
eukprot:scpid106847/ scgid23378/ 